MKRIIICLLFIFVVSHSSAFGKDSLNVFGMNGLFFFIHKAQKGESISQISKRYFVRPSVLARFNNLDFTTELQQNENILVPLTETNYYRNSGIGATTGGYLPVYCNVQSTDNSVLLCSRFDILESTFKRWNNIKSNKLKPNSKVIVGWVKILDSQDEPPFFIKSDEYTLANNGKKLNGEYIHKTIKKPKPIYTNNNTQAVNNTTTNTILKSNTQTTYSTQKQTSPLYVKKKPSELSANKNNYIENQNKGESKTTKRKKSIKSIWYGIVGEQQERRREKLAARKQLALAQKAKALETQTNNYTVTYSNKKPATIVTTTQPKAVANTDKQPSKKNENILKKFWNDYFGKSEPTVKKNTASKVINEKPTKYITASNLNYEETNKAELLKKQIEEKEFVDETKEHTYIENPVQKNSKIIHSQTKQLNFTQKINGKSSTFYSGIRTGTFYVFTNLARKGSIIKITNTINNKFILAEVLGALPEPDLKQGLIIKVSDNAKMPLQISTANFLVMINY